jgi:hypothetical protein
MRGTIPDDQRQALPKSDGEAESARCSGDGEEHGGEKFEAKGRDFAQLGPKLPEM